MKSSKGKGLIGLLMIIAVVAVFGWFGYSSMGDIKLGLDLAGGVSITYQAVEENPTAEHLIPSINCSRGWSITAWSRRCTRKAPTGLILISLGYRMPMLSFRNWESPAPWCLPTNSSMC